MNKLVKTTTKIIGGSALAGIGFSFGRDIYRTGKKNGGKIAVLALAVFAIFGTYVGGLFLARNYRTFFGSVGMRLSGVLILIPSCVVTTITLFIVTIITQMLMPWQLTLDNDSFYVQRTYDENMERIQPSELEKNEFIITYEDRRLVFGSTPTFIGSIGTFLLAIIGFAVGAEQRKTRKKLWKIEEENSKFLTDHNLVENESGKLFEETENLTFRVDSIDIKRITLFPEGKRGKRAYINIDEDGRYAEYTGIVKI
jgi:hypothetical protein